MASVFEKLNLKAQREILVLNAPASFEPELAGLQGIRVRRSLEGVDSVSFALVFACTQAQVDGAAQFLAPLARGDAILWFAYPKAASKKYRCEFNRDTGWAGLQRLGFDTVRLVAIDTDWSAMRFRRVEYIKRQA